MQPAELDREIARHLLGDHPDTRALQGADHARRCRGQIVIEHHRPAGTGAHESRDKSHERRLSGSTRAGDDDALAGADRQRQPAQCRNLAVEDRVEDEDVVEFDHPNSRSRSP